MSAKPLRKTAYATDLTWRVTWQRIAMDFDFRTIAKKLNISVGTAFNWYKLFETTGEVDPKKPSQRSQLRVLDEHNELYIVGLVLHNPTIHLAEISSRVQEISGIEVSTPTLCRLLARYGFSRKKIQNTAIQRRSDFRGTFMATASLYPRNMFVWVDETGCDGKDMQRKYGYFIHGERAICNRLVSRGQRISAIAAMSTEGIIGVELSTGSIDGEKFLEFVHASLVPNMMSFNGCNPVSIAIMDNCSIHHTDEVKDTFSQSQIVLEYLPPYSPDFNPIELVFSFVKQYLKKHEDVQDAFEPRQLIQAAFDSITAEQCRGWITHCHYE